MFKNVNPKVSFPELEKSIYEYWIKNGVIEKYLRRNDGSKKRFSFIDGPITANNPMGVHHAWGRTYKDLWQKFFNMRGYKERFQNGFDCQGLWIEVEVEKELGIRNKRDIENLVPGDKKASVAKFVELCKERVKRFSKIQSEQSQKLGYFMNWNNSYFTMSDENNYMIWHFLRTCFDKGWVYKGRESVPWCPRCETAISQHEMLTEDYKELTHESVIMKFPLADAKDEFLLVWTTTPWTIIANIAVAVDTESDYTLVSSDISGREQRYWLASTLVDQIFKDFGKKIVKTVRGKELVGLRYQSAFDGLQAVEKARDENPEKFHTVIPTDPLLMPISMSEGTGMVHTAVSAGEEDFKLGKKLGLPMIPVIADNADYIGGFGEFSGKNAKKNPGIILDYLKKREEKEGKWVFRIFPYKHRYPACWRCKTELVWKVADEWYISMDKEEKGLKKGAKDRTLRQQMIKTAKMIRWIPDFGLERELDWLQNMHDWLISKKNRYWGLALPIYECSNCGYFTVIGSKEELKEKAIEGWEDFEGHSPHKPYIDSVRIKCDKCGKNVSRLDDVGNVWLDAGIVPFSTLVDPKSNKLSYTSDKKYWREWFPADFITESFPGQFKNWFYSMIAMSTVLEKKNPFCSVLGYASVLGEDGRPMHKSWGNAIEFNEAAGKIGVDVMRWMYVTQKPTMNLLFGYRTADETRRRFHLLLWNIYNFFITYANIDGWTSKEHNNASRVKVNYTVLDLWILSRLNRLVKAVTKNLINFDASTGAILMEDFISDLSLWYIRRSRSRVGKGVTSIDDKNSFYTVTYNILSIFSRLLAPFNPYLSESIYINITDELSVHLSDWPQPDASLISDKLEKKMAEVRSIVELGHAQRKAQNIKVRQPLRLITVYTDLLTTDDSEFVSLIKDELNIKSVEIKPGKENLVVELDTKISQDLLLEGQAREFVRQIQIKRKELGCSLTEEVKVTLPDKNFPDGFEEYIKKETLAGELKRGTVLSVEKL
ncbi:MAG: class I tRNA ligase family protein [Patescibacteria group bacterium]|nr:class I tRNA ligase family protein [Patescibacteria group bacterium]